MLSVHEAISQLFELVKLILMLRIALTWFPNINWWNQPFKFLNDVTEPILEPFRKAIPPLSGIDFSPIFAFMFIFMLEFIVLSFV